MGHDGAATRNRGNGFFGVPPQGTRCRSPFGGDGASSRATALQREIQKFRRSFLRKLRPDLHGKRRDWERFVCVRADADGMSMYPRLLPGATVLIDRHYNSLEPYRRGELNMYAMHVNGACKIRYVESAGDNLVLRPHNQSYSVEIIALENGQKAGDFVVGRVCYVGIEI